MTAEAACVCDWLADFRQELKRNAVLSDIVSLGAYHMNHVRLATLRTQQARERLVNLGELTIKNLRCVVMNLAPPRCAFGFTGSPTTSPTKR